MDIITPSKFQCTKSLFWYHFPSLLSSCPPLAQSSSSLILLPRCHILFPSPLAAFLPFLIIACFYFYLAPLQCSFFLFITFYFFSSLTGSFHFSFHLLISPWHIFLLLILYDLLFLFSSLYPLFFCKSFHSNSFFSCFVLFIKVFSLLFFKCLCFFSTSSHYHIFLTHFNHILLIFSVPLFPILLQFDFIAFFFPSFHRICK